MKRAEQRTRMPWLEIGGHTSIFAVGVLVGTGIYQFVVHGSVQPWGWPLMVGLVIGYASALWRHG